MAADIDFYEGMVHYWCDQKSLLYKDDQMHYYFGPRRLRKIREEFESKIDALDDAINHTEALITNHADAADRHAAEKKNLEKESDRAASLRANLRRLLDT